MDRPSGTALCQICQREFTEQDDLVPRILTGCGHTLCTHCAKQILGTQKRLLCPFDRQPTEVPDGDVRKLKKNYTIMEMKEEEKFRRKVQIMTAKKDKKTRKNDGTCDENSSHRAANFCQSCDADLCDECWDWVHSLAILAHHEKTQLFNKPIDAPPCSEHLAEKTEFVCKDRECLKLQQRLMCHVCFRKRSSVHFNHGYVPLQSEVAEIRTKLLCSLGTAELKEVAIQKNIEQLEGVVKTYSVEGIQFQNKILEVKRFRYFKDDCDSSWYGKIVPQMKKAAQERIDCLQQKIANQKTDIDWIRKNKASIERLMATENIRLVSIRFEVDMTTERIETAIVKHPKSLVTCDMCTAHLLSMDQLEIKLKPTNRLEIRDSSGKIESYIKKKNMAFKNCTKTIWRHKEHSFRIVESTDISPISIFSEGLSLIIVVDPFNGDHEGHCVALELLDNAPAYENIIVGLTPFNFQAVSTFLAKLVDLGEKDPRIHIVYLNDEEKDIEVMMDLSMK